MGDHGMKTTSIGVQNLCVPCHNRCRYCLLSWDGKLPGVDYDRSAAYARRFHEWLRENRSDLSFQFYFGYSMEHPRLLEAIDFMQSLGSAGGRFLQLDGLAFRDEAQTAAFLGGLRAHGIQDINLTIYGTREYHDRFAGRRGDYDYLLTILRTASDIGLSASVGIPVTRENASQLPELIALLEQNRLSSLRCFIPHAEGRGASLDPVRLRGSDFDALLPAIQSRFNRKVFKTEAEWLSSDPLPIPEKRALTISLTPENVDFFQVLPFDETIAYLEKLDDDYYSVLPSIPELMERYGAPAGDGLYSFRDLCLHYQRRYVAEHGLRLYDVTDERGCFSRRY